MSKYPLQIFPNIKASGSHLGEHWTIHFESGQSPKLHSTLKYSPEYPLVVPGDTECYYCVISRSF